MKKKVFTKQNLKWLMSFAFAVMFAVIIGQGMTVRADSSTTMTFGKEYAGTTVKGQIDKYYFTCPTEGQVTVHLNVLDGRIYWNLLDSDYNILDKSYYYSTSEYATGSNRYTFDLTAGTYEFDAAWDNGATYTVSVEFAAGNETYKYSNNMYIDVASQAAIPFAEKITGHFALNDTVDYYKLEVPSNGVVTFSLVNEMERSGVKICDAQGMPITETILFYEGVHNTAVTLNKGIYYLYFEQLRNGTGNYYFTANYELSTPTDVVVQSTSATAMKITAKKSCDITGYNIRYKKGSGSWKNVTVKGNKNLNKTIKGLKPGSYTVQVRAYCTTANQTYYSAWSEAQNVDRKLIAPSNVKVKNSSAKALKITAKKSEKITGYNIRYKKDSGSWRKITVKGNKKLNKTIKKLKQGATYTIQIRTYRKISGKNYYSAWSEESRVYIAK